MPPAAANLSHTKPEEPACASPGSAQAQSSGLTDDASRGWSRPAVLAGLFLVFDLAYIFSPYWFLPAQT